MRNAFVFTRLYLPRPIETAAVRQLLARLMGSDIPRPLGFEVHSGPDGITHLLGCAPTAVQRLKRLLRGLVPGIRFGAAVRPDLAAVSRVVARPRALPFEDLDPEEILAALFQALAGRRGDEALALQLVLGRTQAAHELAPHSPDPLQPLHSRVLEGTRPASGQTQRRLQSRASHPTLSSTVRIGVTASTPKRRAALTWEVFGALQLMESPGVHLSLMRESIARWQRTAPAQQLQLSAGELVSLLGWPLGERDYPGVSGVHPRVLPVPEIVSRTDSVFAVGTAPGPERLIGIDPASRLQHLVVTGPTGSGKSTILERLALADLAAGRACVVIEPKAQLIDSILDAIDPKDAERVVVLNAADHDAVVGFNPLDIGDRDPDIVVDGIIAALAAVFEDGWGPRTEYLIHSALLSLARAGQLALNPYTLIDLPRLLTDVAFRRPVVASVQNDPTLAAFWAEFEELRPAQRAAMIAAPLNKLRKLLLRKPLVAVLGQSRPRFRLRDTFHGEPKMVLVPLNDALVGVGASKLLGSLIVAELFVAALERASEKNPTNRPALFYIDEVQNYLHLPTSISDALGIFRSYGVGLTVAHQHRAQLPPSMRAAFDTNARSKVCFALQADDARDVARMATELTADDFQRLPPYEIYSHLIAGGIPAGWFSARTLPPPTRVGAGGRIREQSRRRYGALPPEPAAIARATTTSDSTRRSAHQKARRP